MNFYSLGNTCFCLHTAVTRTYLCGFSCQSCWSSHPESTKQLGIEAGRLARSQQWGQPIFQGQCKNSTFSVKKGRMDESGDFFWWANCVRNYWNRTAQLEVTFKDHLVQWVDLFRTNQNLEHTDEGLVHMLLQRWHGVSTTLLGSLPEFDHPYCKENFLNVQQVQLCAVLLHLTISFQEQSPILPFPLPFLFCWLDNPVALSISSQHMPFSPVIRLVALL